MKVDKKKVSILKQIVNISKEYMEDCNLAMFTRAMDFFWKMCEFK